MPPRIFISYRRADSQTETDRIYDALAHSYGKRAVFKDVDSIPAGVNFRGMVLERVAQCRVMIVVIGQQWMTVTDAHGNRRLDDPEDLVRFEVEAALHRGIPLIPVLVQGATIPKQSDLPPVLRPLVDHNAISVRNAPDFQTDIQRLKRALRSHVQDIVFIRAARRVLIFGGLIAALLLVVLSLVNGGNTESPFPTTQVLFLDTQAPTSTPTPEPTATLTASATPTRTPEPTRTFTPSHTITGTVTITDTPSITPTADTYTAALERARSFTGTHNADWEPFVYTFPDDPAQAPMVLVPVGSFQMGSNAYEDEQPIHTVTFTTPFWMDLTEVTRGQWNECVDLGVCEVEIPANFSFDSDHPINYVTWLQAQRFCVWRGDEFRLPTEADWEYAARGVEGWIYPWGNNRPTDNYVVFGGLAKGGNRVGTRPLGASWSGALDMSGNLWEWVSTIYGVDNDADGTFDNIIDILYSYPYDLNDGREQLSNILGIEYRVLRGESYGVEYGGMRSANRNWEIPTGEAGDVGFRCARDA